MTLRGQSAHQLREFRMKMVEGGQFFCLQLESSLSAETGRRGVVGGAEEAVGGGEGEKGEPEAGT